MATLNVASSLKKSVRPEVYSEIWIAEDNTDVRIFLQRAFRNSEPSPNLVFFRNGAELVEHFHEHSPLPRLLLLDMEMPVMNGLTALSCIGADAYSAKTPVVIFSSLENPEIVRQAYRSGAKLYLKKPARLDGFSDVAELCVHCAEAIRALPSGRLPLAAFEAKEALQLLLRAVPAQQQKVGRSRAGSWS